MEVELITNREQGVLKKMIEILSLQGEKKIVLGEIEDAVYHRLCSYIGEKDEIFLSVDRKRTTKQLTEELAGRKFFYVCNNNLNDKRNVNNLVVVKDGE